MIEKGIQDSLRNLQEQSAKQHFQKLIQQNQYVGELYSINYETAKVQIQDFERQKVGGIPSLSFLIATRIVLGDDNIDFRKEDSSVILLRVMDAAALPNNSEAERLRVENAQRVSGTENHWDNKSIMDARTNVYLGYAAVECRIIGTLFLDSKDESNPESPLVLKFGCDISNYYPNRGLKVYKPNDEALKTIVNYIDPSVLADYKERFHNTSRVQLGTIRYASTNRKYQQIDDVSVSIFPSDLLSQKSAVFGMTRTGKSNTVKIIAKSVYELRYPQNLEDKSFRVGQIIFDPNGEYANENVQDNNSALKNIWQLKPNKDKDKEVVTYGIIGHPNDPDRKLMLLNFHLDSNLQIGKEIIDTFLSNETAIYFRNFTHVLFERPDINDNSAITRYNRRVLAYRAILSRAGFVAPSNVRPNPTGLFSKELLQAMQTSSTSNNASDYQSAAIIFANSNASWGQIATAFESLDKFMRDNTSNYQQFETYYVNRPKKSGERWADEDLKKILGLFQYPNGTRLIGRMAIQHTDSVDSDYADDIYQDLKNGKLVIIDQSSGEPDINKSSAERIMWVLFRKNQELFREGKVPPEILVYLEEAHNLLPSGKDDDTTTVWVRTAKEGAKYRIGMIYSTQEVSSIQKNILKNTANWFIGHLNNTDETKELCKFYDFADFESSIRRTQDKGFLRVKTLSNYFVIPVQVKKFDIND
jgi:DNA helicase HerA-like ATPase